MVIALFVIAVFSAVVIAFGSAIAQDKRGVIGVIPDSAGPLPKDFQAGFMDMDFEEG